MTAPRKRTAPPRRRDGVPPPTPPDTPGPSTLAVHAGEPRQKPGNALTTPIMQTATYTFADTQELRDHFDGTIERDEYGRYGNPTQRIAEPKLAALEGAGDCLLVASGMAAITTTCSRCSRGALTSWSPTTRTAGRGSS